MASKGEVGIDLDVRKVPLREADMEPFEIMISESQERMLCVVEPERVADVLAVCERWETRATAIGVVTGTRCGSSTATSWWATCRWRRSSTTSRSTTSSRRRRRSRSTPRRARCSRAGAGERETLLALLGSANLASRRWAFEQYDQLVGSATVPPRRPPTPPSCGSPTPARALGVSIDGNGRRVACDPYRGAVEAVLECSANLACVGAEPLGLTNCLNFGNPEKPHIAWQLTRAVAGLGDACRALGVPVVGGNVSLYNEGGGRADLPDARGRHGRRAPPTPRAPAGSASRRRATRWR